MDGTEQPTPEDIDLFIRRCGLGQLDVVRREIADGMAVNVANSVGYTPLMSAARNFRADVVDELLAHGADVGARMETQETPLHLAVGGSPEMPAWYDASSGPSNGELQAHIVTALLDAGADVTARSELGMTPLMTAAWFGCTEAAALLVARPQDLAATNEKGLTAIDVARQRDNTEIAELIEQALRD
ncbi:MAG: ankyrin repeat domain-containing protein [Actinomycetota bacterium]|nr:ankyrin repeat domain-containing protein [Actinomycetota bacterium]